MAQGPRRRGDDWGISSPVWKNMDKGETNMWDGNGGTVRKPAVAGMFYEADADDLRAEIERCFLSPFGPGRLPESSLSGARDIVGLVSPHAGLIYSGPTAAHGYLRLAEDGQPELAVLLGVNHRGYGDPVSVGITPAWRTPLGDVEVDAEAAKRIAALSGYASENELAHRIEHSLEVQVPFLQYLYGAKIRIVPVVMSLSVREPVALHAARDIGAAATEAVAGRNAVVIASTDFSHYESRESAEARDSLAIGHILEMDEEGLLRTVREMDISMCGAAPTAAGIAACRLMGAQTAVKLAYGTSGDISGDYSQVVGYASIEFRR